MTPYGELRKQILWSMSQQVRFERTLTRKQLVLQGFVPQLEDQNIEAAMQARVQWIMRSLVENTHLSKKRLALKSSHATAVEALSRLSIITLEEASVAVHVARGMNSKRFNYAGASIMVNCQQAAYDRFVSVPAKACMDILTRHEGRYPTGKKEW